VRRPGLVIVVALAMLLAPAGAPATPRASSAAEVEQADARPPSAADVARAWVRDWGRGEETAVCSVVDAPLLKQMALASGTSACSGAVASALRAGSSRWDGASIVTSRAELIDDRLARVTFTIRHSLRDSAPVLPDRIFLTRPDARTGSPWRIASLGLLPFIASGTSEVTYDPSTLDPPGSRERLRDPVRPGRLSPGCSGRAVTVEDAGGDVRGADPPPRAPGQLLPHHPRGDRFGTILADRPFVFTGPRRHVRSLDLRALTMVREADGQVCLQVRFAQAPRPDSRLLVRWFEPLPGSETVGTSGAVELRFDGRGALHFWFDRNRSTISDPDLAPRFRARTPEVGRRGSVLSIRLSKQDIRDPERFRIALQSASTTTSDPGDVPRVSAGDTMGGQTSGYEWPGGRRAPLYDIGSGPST
jgi:hypothetical protein